ncbi:hypothetical protein A2U01_0093322, partial [Trifolium medium]|nr:hypothetical protein [Trifolium medium]
MDLCNTDIIKRYITELSKPAFRTPGKERDDGDVDSSSGYSPDVA